MEVKATREKIHETQVRGAITRQYKKALELDDEARDMQLLIRELEEVRAGVKELKRRVLIAYADGYESGHANTLNSQNGHLRDPDPDAFDKLAIEWYAEAIEDGTFDRELETEEAAKEELIFEFKGVTKPDVDGLGLLYTQDTETK